MPEHIATLPTSRDAAASRRGRNLRRVGIVLMCLLVLAALTGLLGPRAAVTSAAGGGYELTVRHAQVTRPSIPMPLEITVRRDGGFDGPVTLSIGKDLLDRADFNDWYPNPDGETSGPDRLEYEFAPPAGEVLHVMLDARTAPGQLPSSQRYAVAVVDQDVVMVETDFRMTVLP
ncbi:hypothetical protein [Jiangella rhizosphaerae]|uniref:Uncharacterized protein n=1 Tax=Jiangella rhizosphaerae TaxID=2293569 RepID=A0A418KMU6_9ACTN|nr:hypothetical protein [Jiangella rhizosphaerae]RIQ20323.1 hypothetical protein DY240_18405 [Jiangella rhizosphaerae]